MNTVQVYNQELQIKEWNGQRVVTFKDIDLVHERPEGTAQRNFKANRKHFIEGEDYCKITLREFGTNFVPKEKMSGNPNVSITLITESGYLMLVKSFTDDLAWKVQRQLVNCYFRVKEVVTQPSKFQPKASSIGEIVQLGRFIRQLMKDQHATPYEIAGAVMEGIEQFGIRMPKTMVLPAQCGKLERVKEDELDMVEFACTFPNSGYQDYLLYRAMINTSRGM